MRMQAVNSCRVHPSIANGGDGGHAVGLHTVQSFHETALAGGGGRGAPSIAASMVSKKKVGMVRKNTTKWNDRSIHWTLARRVARPLDELRTSGRGPSSFVYFSPLRESSKRSSQADLHACGHVQSIYVVRNGGEISMMLSPRTYKYFIFLFVTLTISS